MKPSDRRKDTNELLRQIRDAILEGNEDRKIIKGHERVISQNTTAIRESRETKDSNPKADPLTRTQRATVNEVKGRFRERRIANPKYSQLSVSKEVDREFTRLGKSTGFDSTLSLNHRVWLEIKREDVGLPPF